jgi:hypothetical protein
MFWQEAVIFKGSVVIFKVERRGDVAEALFPKKIRRRAVQVTPSDRNRGKIRGCRREF